MSILTAKQNIERCKGAAAERKWMAAQIWRVLRDCNTFLYLRIELRHLLHEMKEREVK